MTRGTLLASICALIVGVTLAGCGADNDSATASTPTTSASASNDGEEAAVIAAYTAFLAEKKAIQNSGEVPGDAYRTTLAPVRLEKELAIARRYADAGLVRVGQLEVKDHEVIDLDADSATLVVCQNEDPWGFKPKGQEVDYPEIGWGPRGTKVVRVDGRWLVAESIHLDRLPTTDCAG